MMSLMVIMILMVLATMMTTSNTGRFPMCFGATVMVILQCKNVTHVWSLEKYSGYNDNDLGDGYPESSSILSHVSHLVLSPRHVGSRESRDKVPLRWFEIGSLAARLESCGKGSLLSDRGLEFKRSSEMQ